MFKAPFVLLAVTLAVASGCGSHSHHDHTPKAPKLRFAFYITSQCRDTINFITRQLEPTYQELSEYLDVEFVPWGKTKRNTDGTLTCQFGPTDCVANKIQSCVLNMLGDNQAKQVDYITCEMRNLFAVVQNYQCVRNVQESEDAAKQCFESTLGDQLQAQAEAKTNAIPMLFVPTIVLNGTYETNVQNAAYANFKGFVCSRLTAEAPAACQS